MRKLVVMTAVVAAMLGVIGAAVPAWALVLDPSGLLTDPGDTYLLVTDPVDYVQIYEDEDYLFGTGDYWIYTGTFESGVTYELVLIVPENADFDIKIYDENGYLVASGTEGRGVNEVVYLTPWWTGPLTIQVYSYSGSGFYTLEVFREL